MKKEARAVPYPLHGPLSAIGAIGDSFRMLLVPKMCVAIAPLEDEYELSRFILP
jgi:hypothetical protein